MKFTFNQQFVDSLVGEEKQYDVYDAAQKGLFLRVRKSGSKIYYLKRDGVTSALGNAEILTLASIRETVLLRYDIRDVSQRPLVKMSVEKFYNTEMRGYIESLKPKTQKDYTRHMEHYILPVFRKRSLSSITISEVREFHQAMKETKYQANRVLSTLSRMFSFAYELEYIATNNPCKAVKRFQEEKRERHLSNEELARLKTYLYNHRTTDKELVHSLVIEFLILTGCRVSEALSLKKEKARGHSIIWHDTKTGLKQLPMTDRLQGIIIQAGTKNPTTKVFARPNVCSQSSVSKYWGRVRKELNMEDVRIHDLRHTFASFALKGGFSLEHIRDLLNHKDIASTIRYVHVTKADMKSALDSVAKNMGF